MLCDVGLKWRDVVWLTLKTQKHNEAYESFATKADLQPFLTDQLPNRNLKPHVTEKEGVGKLQVVINGTVWAQYNGS